MKKDDLDKLRSTYQNNEKFRQHDLLKICLRIYQYITNFAKFKVQYEIFCKDRKHDF